MQLSYVLSVVGLPEEEQATMISVLVDDEAKTREALGEITNQLKRQLMVDECTKLIPRGLDFNYVE